jgi:histone deacetylase 6
MNRHPLVVIFHDPPAIRVEPDPVTGETQLHDIWLVSARLQSSAVTPLTVDPKTDVVSKDYVGWAVDNGFQVIDVNIPKVVAVEDVGTCRISF